jgi:hypothetical protein
MVLNEIGRKDLGWIQLAQDRVTIVSLCTEWVPTPRGGFRITRCRNLDAVPRAVDQKLLAEPEDDLRGSAYRI